MPCDSTMDMPGIQAFFHQNMTLKLILLLYFIISMMTTEQSINCFFGLLQTPTADPLYQFDKTDGIT